MQESTSPSNNHNVSTAIGASKHAAKIDSRRDDAETPEDAVLCAVTSASPPSLHPIPQSQRAQILDSIHTAAKQALVINTVQRGNPLIKHIRNVVITYKDQFDADYLVGPHSCVLFLSLQYHLLHPKYIFDRVRQLGMQYKLRVLLVLADTPDPVQPLAQLTKMCMIQNYTMVCADSSREAARYLETYRSFESKAPDAIMEKTESDYMSRLNGCVTAIKPLTKRDAMSLLASFKSVKSLMMATEGELKSVPGIGQTKIKRLIEAFHAPLKKKQKVAPSSMKKDAK